MSLFVYSNPGNWCVFHFHGGRREGVPLPFQDSMMVE